MKRVEERGLTTRHLLSNTDKFDTERRIIIPENTLSPLPVTRNVSGRAGVALTCPSQRERQSRKRYSTSDAIPSSHIVQFSQE